MSSSPFFPTYSAMKREKFRFGCLSGSGKWALSEAWKAECRHLAVQGQPLSLETLMKKENGSRNRFGGLGISICITWATALESEILEGRT